MRAADPSALPLAPLHPPREDLVLTRRGADAELRGADELLGTLHRRGRWGADADAEVVAGRFELRRRSAWRGDVDVVDAASGRRVAHVTGAGLTGRRRITPESGEELSYRRRGFTQRRIEVADRAGGLVLSGSTRRGRRRRLELAAERAPDGIDPALLALVVAHVVRADDDAASSVAATTAV